MSTRFVSMPNRLILSNRMDDKLDSDVRSGTRHKNSWVDRKSWIACQSVYKIESMKNAPHNAINLHARPATGASCVTCLRLDNVVLVSTPMSSYLCERNTHTLPENSEARLFCVRVVWALCLRKVLCWCWNLTLTETIIVRWRYR